MHQAVDEMGARSFTVDKRADDRDLLYKYSVITFILFCLRDGFTGSARYVFHLMHADFIWFIPDMMAFVSLGIFIYMQFFKDKNFNGIFFTLAFVWSMIVSVFFMNDNLLAFFSSMKMFIPMFVGMCFYGRSITEQRWVRTILLLVFLFSAIGTAINPYVQYPWYGQSFLSIGDSVRTTTKIWWTGGAIRYGGFAGDSTMAGFMTLFTFVLVSPYYGKIFNIMCWPLVYFALNATTSKTAIGLAFVYFAYYSYTTFFPVRSETRLIKTLAKLSYLALAVPPLLMLLLGGVDLASYSQNLMSLADRINNTWQGPFIFLNDHFPIGLFVGCGIGCYAYPMAFYGPLAQYYIPLDNFYLSTAVMMGYPVLIFFLLQFKSLSWTEDKTKLLLIFLWNIYSITVQCYGPSYATLVYGYAVSEVFRTVKRRRAAAPQRIWRPDGLGSGSGGSPSPAE